MRLDPRLLLSRQRLNLDGHNFAQIYLIFGLSDHLYCHFGLCQRRLHRLSSSGAFSSSGSQRSSCSSGENSSLNPGRESCSCCSCPLSSSHHQNDPESFHRSPSSSCSCSSSSSSPLSFPKYMSVWFNPGVFVLIFDQQMQRFANCSKNRWWGRKANTSGSYIEKYTLSHAKPPIYLNTAKWKNHNFYVPSIKTEKTSLF